MSETPPPSSPSVITQLKEVRYNLRQLQAEVAIEQESGIFGMEKLQQKDIGRLFKAKPRKRRGPTT